MILLGSNLTNTPVMGLQTGSELARRSTPIIDPATLTIVAYELTGPLVRSHSSLLRVADIRELSDLGVIIDSDEEFIEPGDVVTINKLIELGFSLDGKLVTDEKSKKLDKIVDYTLETGGFVIQQLTVKRPMLRSLNDTELLIHRSQIIEINDKAIVVHSEAKAPEPDLQEVVGSYVNPFRKSKGSEQPESIDR